MRKKLIILGAGLLCTILLLVTAFVLWAVIPLDVMEEAETALRSNSQVTVESHKDIEFIPVNKEYTQGVILYPGTRVNSEAYAPLAQKLAQEGYLVILAQMPLDLSVLDIDRATSIMQSHPQIQNWAVAGHSMGGAMAAYHIAEQISEPNNRLTSLIMLGAYPSKSTDLSEAPVNVLSIYGSEDFIASKEEIEQKQHLFPTDATYVEIEGGNHAGFGYYGEQKGDGVTTISREEQHDMIADAILWFLEMNDR